MAIGPVVPQMPPDTGPSRKPESPGVAANQPVAPLGAAQPQLTRTAPLPVALQDPAAARVRAQLAADAKGQLPQGSARADAQAPRSVAVALGAALERLLALLSREGALSTGAEFERGGRGGAAQALPWPRADSPADPADALATEPRQAWQRLHADLARAGLFRIGAETASAEQGEAPAPASSLSSTNAAPAPLPAPGSERLRDALQFLLHGQLQWAGAFTPDVPAEIRREDAWQEDPQQPGRLLGGCALVLTLDLPRAGRVRLRAQQCGSHGLLRLETTADRLAPFADAWPALRTRLDSLADRPAAPISGGLKLELVAVPPEVL